MIYKYIPSCNKKFVDILISTQKRCVLVLIRSTEVLLMNMVSITYVFREKKIIFLIPSLIWSYDILWRP